VRLAPVHARARVGSVRCPPGSP